MADEYLWFVPQPDYSNIARGPPGSEGPPGPVGSIGDTGPAGESHLRVVTQQMITQQGSLRLLAGTNYTIAVYAGNASAQSISPDHTVLLVSPAQPTSIILLTLPVGVTSGHEIKIKDHTHALSSTVTLVIQTDLSSADTISLQGQLVRAFKTNERGTHIHLVFGINVWYILDEQHTFPVA